MNIKFLWELLFSVVGTHELHTAFGANLFKVETAHMLEAYWGASSAWQVAEQIQTVGLSREDLSEDGG